VPRPAGALLPVANASGAALYQRECAPCHGPAGHGDGPEAPTFRNTPRDLGDLARAAPAPRILERVRRSRMRMLEIDEEVVAERRKRMVEELVGHLQRMPDAPWPLVRRGADVYAERCETCHGPNARPVTVSLLQRGPQPTGPQPPPDVQKAHGDAELLRIARGEGHPVMPGFAAVANEEEARALLAYLRILSNGFSWYSLWCAGCHGDEGRGDGMLATGVDRPGVALDRAYLSAQSPADLRRKAMHLFSDAEPAAPHFQRDLSDGQTRAVLAAVRAIQADEAGKTSATAAASPAIGAPEATPAPPTPLMPSATTPAAATAVTAATTPAAAVSPAATAARAPIVKPAKPQAGSVKKPPAKRPVKPRAKPTPKPKSKPKPKAKAKLQASPAKKPATPRPTATPAPVLAP